MGSFFRSIHIDALSFWIGCLAATIFWFFVQNFRKVLPALREQRQSTPRAEKRTNLQGVEDRLRKEVLRKAQSAHLAASLCPLDECLVEPRLLQPPLQHEPGTPYPPEEILSIATAYLPDWPEIPARLGEPTLSILDALSCGLHLAITGQAGMGKTVLLADLASRIARRDPTIGAWGEKLPLYLHAASLRIPDQPSADPLIPFIDALGYLLPGFFNPRLPGLVQLAARSGEAILILDGMDELSVASHQQVSKALIAFTQAYPLVRVVVSGDPAYLGDLLANHFQPFAIAAWDDHQYACYLDQWERLWSQSIRPLFNMDGKTPPQVDPALIRNWLLAKKGFSTPLAFALNVWAAYAGDVQGVNLTDTLESYLQRLVPETASRQIIQFAAMSLATSGMTVIEPARIASLYNLLAPSSSTAVQGESQADAIVPQSGADLPKVFAAGAESGLLVEQTHERYTFINPLILGYLAAQAITPGGRKVDLLSRPHWSARTTTLQFLAVAGDNPPPVRTLIDEDLEPFYQGTLEAARWLIDSSPTATWRGPLLRRLVDLLQRKDLPLAVRQQCMCALALSRDPGIPTLFRQWLKSEDAEIRLLSAMACSILEDGKAISDLNGLLEDASPVNRYAACLALSRLGGRSSQETLTDILNHADEDLRRAAAEALARLPQNGHPVLREASTSEDLLTRRAAVYGLIHIQSAWVDEQLGKMNVEDDQWVVRNAAAQAIDARQKRLTGLPHPLPAPADSPWLVTFAANRGTGIPAGSTAADILLSAYQEGTEEERLAALEYLKQFDDASVYHAIQAGLQVESPAVSEASYWALLRYTQWGAKVATVSTN